MIDKSNMNTKQEKIASSFDKCTTYLNTKRVPGKTYYNYGNLNSENYFSCGNFEIPAGEKKVFFTTYQNMVFKNKYKGKIGITELPEEYGYWRLDFDFRWNHRTEQPLTRLYNKELIKKIITVCRCLIEEICLNLNNEMLICIVLEKENPRVDKGFVKDGFHLRFPHFIISKEIGDKYLRDQLITKLENSKMFHDMHTANSIHDIVDPVMGKNWLLYGSSKGENAGYLKVTDIYNKENENITLKETFPLALNDTTQPDDYYLPSLLSVRYSRAPNHAEIKKGLIAPKNVKIKETYTESNRSTENVTKDLAWIEDSDIMSLLSEERCDNHNTWLDVGFILYCIGQGHPHALDIWKEWSGGSESYNEGCCEAKWVNMSDRGRTIGSLKYYAKLDSPEKYATLVKESADESLDDSLRSRRPTNMGIARIMHKLFEGQFKCTDSKRNIWMEFRQHVWHELDEGQTVKMVIVRDIREMFYNEYEKLRKSSFGDDDDDDSDGDASSEKVKKKCKKILAVIEALDGTAFIEGVMRGCKILFHDSEFNNIVNRNPNLYAFKNGVFDLKLNIFRDGVPDDNITIQSKVNYRKPNEAELNKITKWLRQLFPNPNIRKYWVRTRVSTFQGGNRDKKIWFHTGKGWAGKSGAEAAMEKIHGPYRFKIPAEMLLLNDMKSSGGPSVALWRGRFCRLLMTEEVGVNQQLNMGLLKKWSGGDTLYARTHREEGEEFDPEFKFDMYLNECPRIPSQDKALFGRIRLIDYPARYGNHDDGSEPPEDEEEQFAQNHYPANINFVREELPGMLEPLAWYLLQDWSNYLKYGLEEPAEVRDSTSKYEKRNDTFLQFIDDKLEIVTGEKAEKSMITTQEMKNAFNEWYKQEYPSYKNSYGLGKIKDEMNTKFKPIGDKGKWHGAKFKVDVEGVHGGTPPQSVHREGVEKGDTTGGGGGLAAAKKAASSSEKCNADAGEEEG